MNLIEVMLQGIPISEEQYIGDSLEFINMAFTSLTGGMRSMQLTISSDLVKPVQLGKLSNAFASHGQVITYDASTSTWIPSATFSLPKNAYSGQVLTFDGSTNSWIPSATVRIADELPKNATDGQLLAYYASNKAWLPKDAFSLPSTQTNGQVLAYNASTSSWQASSLPPGIPLPLSLNSLSVTGAARGFVITYDSSTGTWVPSAAPGSGMIPLDKLLSTGAVAGDAIVYNTATQTWVPSAVGAKLPTDALPGQVLTFDGTTNSWKPSATAVIETIIPLTRISIAGTSDRDVIIFDSATNEWTAGEALPAGAPGQVLTYDGSTSSWIPSAVPMPTNYINLKRDSIVGNGGATYTLTTFPSENAEDYIIIVDGVVQAAGDSYTVASGGILTFTNAIPTGSNIISIVAKPATVFSTNIPTFKKNIITTTAGTATYSLLNYSNNNPENYLVYLNGVMQAPGEDYTISGPQITLIPAPDERASLLVMALINADGTQANTTNNSQIFTDTTGRVGINTINPTERLTVNGNILATGTIFSSSSTFTNAISAPSLSGTFVGNIRGSTASFNQGVSSLSFVGGSVTGTTATFATSVSTQNLSGTDIRGRTATFTESITAPVIRGSFQGDGSGLTNVGGVGSVRAWANFNAVGTVSIRASQNISSITDNGVGNFILNFTNHLADSNYVVSVETPTTGTAGSGLPGTIATVNPRGAGVLLTHSSSCQIRTYYLYAPSTPANTVANFNTDVETVHFAAIR
jgi:hypothetical protein